MILSTSSSWITRQSSWITRPSCAQLTSARFVQALSNLRGKVGDGKDQGIVTPPADGQSTPYPFANLIPQDGTGKVFQRTPAEVLAIVYGGNSTQAGGFYPKGMTGTINGITSSA